VSSSPSASEPEFKTGGFVPSGPVHVVLQEPMVFVRLDAQPSDDESPDAMVVTYDET
jgi:hypothetical protein